MPFFDMHCHMLCHVDDGAKTKDVMFSMLETAYADGIRAICLTPHFSPYLFGDTYRQSEQAFALLQDYAAQRYPDLQLFLGHELGYHRSCVSALHEGHCRTLGGSRYVLVDFPERVDFFELKSAMMHLRSMGFLTVLAHAERYGCLFSHFQWVKEYVAEGGIVQVNASSLEGAWGTLAKLQSRRMLRARLVHVISTDAHNLTTRPPKMSVCMPYLQKHCDEETVHRLVWENAWRIVQDRSL